MKEERIQELIKTCAKCGACRSVCPLLEVDQMETAVARGKIEVIRRDLTGELLEANRKAVLSFLDNCLLCGRCEFRCPNQVKTVEIISSAKAKHSGGAGDLFGKKALVMALGMSSSAVKRISFVGRGLLDIFAERVPSNSGIYYKLPALFGGRERMIPEIPLQFYLEKKGVKISEVNEGQVDILFAGCVYNYMYPHVLENIENSLEKQHREKNIVSPVEQSCCGLPALGAGDMNSAVDHGKNNLELFRRIKDGKIVFPCASCLYMVKKVYPDLFAGTDLHELSLEVSERCVDYESYLLESAVMTAKPSHIYKGETISYHRPCHLLSIPGAVERAESLLKGVFDAKFKEMKGSDKCCGFGGTFNIVNYDKSREIGASKIKLAEESGTEIIATSCSGCVNQLKESAARMNSRIKILHMGELFDFVNE